ncbi:ADP-ribosyl cyclase/cyclic ADP-ribose hydrolase 1-like isoform X2 [Betta splendens]|uniref:ADP-ribosyl cyclase/cyclic ADP-ribose hydrolase n=1 Tax=Betta splendens TaxID=158456 RepID=A0A6P7MDM3_BETSP|nr:ADP-ribosyl cyclase/cyclic ADP-ribose hydrolase 1-like isoform X2 [Betta splendens]
MEQDANRTKRRSRRIFICVAVVLVVIFVLALVLGLSRRNQGANGFQSTFIERCEKFNGPDCQNIWKVFSQAYVRRDPCNVPMEAYNALMAAASIQPVCNRELFWSKTKQIVHAFTAKRDCYITMEDTLLGFMLDGLTWCGKENSSETFTSGCPGWSQCENNPVRSFWNRASAAFAEAACGDVTVMLNGSISTPFSPASIFGSIEIKRLNYRVRSLNVILVTQNNTGLFQRILKRSPGHAGRWDQLQLQGSA